MQPIGMNASRLLSILRGVQIRGSSLICINITVLRNSYGHPHKEIIERLEDVGADILTTTECGAIILEIDDAVSIRTVKHN